MDASPTGPDVIAAPTPLVRLGLAIVIAFAGDNLLYDHAPGVSLAVFLAVLAVAMASSSTRRCGPRQAALSAAGFVAGLVPLAVDLSILSLLIGLCGLVLATLAWTGGLSKGWRTGLEWTRDILVRGPGRMVPDIRRDLARRAASGTAASRAAAAVGWVVPLALLGVFAALLSSANPVIAAWADAVPWSALVPTMDPPRALAWAGLTVAGWTFVGVRLAAREGKVPGDTAAMTGAATWTDAVLSTGTLLRCLVPFNLLFLVQGSLDASYLLGGVALPAGMTLADYAHRGAYPLVATAILAAAFTLAAMRPGGAGERSRPVRWLVLLWVAQNIVLVASAMLRLGLYVETYALTLTRVAAFVWMGLVATGLALILARIAFRFGNGWLVRSNAAVLAATLYGCSLVSFPALVADYNVGHARAGTGGFDPFYALWLGPEAIPAVDRWLADEKGSKADYVAVRRQQAARTMKELAGDWRSWTVRRGALLGYLRQNPVPPRMPATTAGEAVR